MTVVDLTPGSEAWSRLITASKVAAILGVSPWNSPRSIWHEMRGEVPREQGKPWQARGHYLEPAILAWWRDQHPELLAQSPMDTQRTFTLDDWAAATPDGCLWTDDVPKEILPCGIARPGVLVEAKSAADMDEWGDPGTDVIPAYYLAQVYWQLHLSGAARCYVPVIGPRLRFSEYVVEANAEFGADLERRMRAFYDSLSGDVPPDLDDTTATYEVIRRIHPDIERGDTVQLAPEQAREYVESANEKKAAEKRETGAKSVVLDRMGRAQYAECNGVRIARRQRNKYGVSLVQIAKTTETITEESSVA